MLYSSISILWIQPCGNMMLKSQDYSKIKLYGRQCDHWLLSITVMQVPRVNSSTLSIPLGGCRQWIWPQAIVKQLPSLPFWCCWLVLRGGWGWFVVDGKSCLNLKRGAILVVNVIGGQFFVKLVYCTCQIWNLVVVIKSGITHLCMQVLKIAMQCKNC